MIAWAANTTMGGVGILATAGDNPTAAALIGGLFTLANTLLVWRLNRRRDRKDKDDDR